MLVKNRTLPRIYDILNIIIAGISIFFLIKFGRSAVVAPTENAILNYDFPIYHIRYIIYVLILSSIAAVVNSNICLSINQDGKENLDYVLDAEILKIGVLIWTYLYFGPSFVKDNINNPFEDVGEIVSSSNMYTLLLPIIILTIIAFAILIIYLRKWYKANIDRLDKTRRISMFVFPFIDIAFCFILMENINIYFPRFF